MNYRSCHIWFLIFLLLPTGRTAHSAQEPARVPEVSVTRPVVREVTDHEDFTGRTEAAARVDLRPRVAGYLTSARFKEGNQVRQGDILFEIDPRPYQTQLDQALSQVDLSKATLRLARATLARDQALAKAGPGSVSPQQLDQDQAAADEAVARVKAAEASAEVCKLNLSFCKLNAPISGRIGQRLVDPGNLVNQDQTLLAVLVGEDPMYVYFDIDERTFLWVRRSNQKGKLEAGKLPVAVGLADEEGFPRQGVLDFTSDRVDPDTGAIRMRAVLPNKDNVLAPGLFVRVRLALGAPYKALLVSDRTIASDQGLKYVYVIDAENKVRYRRVMIGALQSDGLRVIAEGLKPDERVVSGRLHGLRPGMTVRPQEGDTPVPKLPQPSEAPPSARAWPGRGILVEATYPGASAQVVSDSVRSPIEQQVSGLENIRYMRSRCTQDGKYVLDVTLAPGVDLWRTQVLVQNRVALAFPMLPKEVQNAGVNVRRGTSGVLLVVNLFSPDGKHDSLYLGNYARIHIKDELSRLAGVGDVALLGASDHGLRIWLDPERLAARTLNAGDVTGVLRSEKLDGTTDPEKVMDLIVKTDEQGRVVRLRDVAKVELGAFGPQSQAFQGDKPVVALFVHLTGEASPQKVRAAVRGKLAEIRDRLPDGLVLDDTFDFTANLETRERTTGADYVLLDLDFPAASAERTGDVLKRSESLLRKLPGVQSVLALPENPFDLFGGRPSLLVRLITADESKPDREEVIRAIRARLGALDEVNVRSRDFSAPGCFPRCGYPIDLALHGPDAAEVREWANKLGDRLRRNQKLRDVWVNSDSAPRPGQFVDINREKAAALGVAVADVFSAIEVYAGALPVNHFNRFGRTLRVEVQAGARSSDWAKDLGKLKVRNAKGQMVALGSFVTVRKVESPLALDFLDFCPMVELTANAEAGVSLEAGKKLCTTLADEVRKEMGLTAEYRLTWLSTSRK